MEQSKIISKLLAIREEDTRERGDENRSPFSKSNRARTRELGLQLWELGGLQLMQEAWSKIPRYDQRELECAWDGIGGRS